MSNLLERILSSCADDELLIADGLDDAVIGIEINTSRVIYSVSKCIEILMQQGMNKEDAIEHFYFNVSGAYVGEKTPIFCDSDF